MYRPSLGRKELEATIAKWTPLVAELKSRGEDREAAKWQEAIDAAHEILERRKRTHTGRSADHMRRIGVLSPRRKKRD